ncbi:PREDICTED: LOW QUALITY PROTEIN: aladin [Tarenaya hassleriana]|uniref:LOW QUALITY PROTEIN: aladin n=1 Tax=Tarenaya hassleriana TaxID=28532 RepID=UPI00053C2B50|nr:PREDICTED: LOW QUALITY PROTEIN: aladin [Tarenaya hassleriana]
MASFPHPGSVTVCEINRDLITAQSLSDGRAEETYGKLLGMVFDPVSFELGPSPQQENEQHEGGDMGSVERKGLVAMLQVAVKGLLHPTDVRLLSEIDLQGVSWHQHRHTIAFISGPSQVTIRDYEDKEEKEPCILTSDSQRNVKALDWRPNGGKSLSVACRGGVCIWAASYPGNMALVRSRGSSLTGSISRGTGTRWTLVDFLRCGDDEQISALSWSPCGRYLASASYDSSSFTIWDVAQGAGTPIRRGLGGISMLKWSPTGDYFFAAKFDGTFYLWETNTWTSEPWSSSTGFVTGATWDPEGRLILIAFSKSSTLGSIHFSSKPPSLDAHLLPVDLPEIASLTGSEGIEKIAWDGSGERLAVSYKGGDDNYKGLIAIYDTRRTPIVSASLVGFIRGPGENPKPLSFSFHDKFKQGPLLSVCWNTGFCCTYPLIFRSNVLPLV